HGLPEGCRFAGRCPVELPQCATQRPVFTQTDVGRGAACHLLTEARP
ncbi:MAG: peptide ABC transporter ATP-binding protein, partial [Oceanibulbus sp.]|nr:peptide ABC transporter ATP-binding protein [Sulfitobacter sp.]